MKARHWIWLRRSSQAFFLILFVFLLVESRLPNRIFQNYSVAFSGEQDLRIHWPVRFFFQLDPLIFLSSLISGHKLLGGLLWALAVMLMTVAVGRVFCGFICPLGTLQHMVANVRPSLKARQRMEANQKTPAQRIKYLVLILVLMAGFLGVNLAGVMDPIAFLFRSLGLSLIPALGTALRSLFRAMAESGSHLLGLLSYGAEVLLAPVFGYEAQAYQTAWFMGLLFLFILVLNRNRARFWCRYLCPLGALLAILSRFSLLKLEREEDKCTHCGLCTAHCQGAANPEPNSPWEQAECVSCLNCFDLCPEGVLHFRFHWAKGRRKAPDMGRRAVLAGMLGGMSLPFLGRLDGSLDKVGAAELIRPPGAIEEKKFLTLCQRCGLCMKVCPTNVINPTLTEAGVLGLWTPRLIMTMGYCEYTCTLCGSVCPTGAIQELSAEEKIKRPVRIGSAYVDRGRCLPWSGNVPCIVCEEHCPTSPKAIYLKKETVRKRDGFLMEVQVPFVDLKQCVGCGICEYKCPVKVRPAISVIAGGETRSLKNRLLL